MRVLVVSDLHANPAAIAAVREPFDACLCLGDLVEYGPDPGPCLDWVRANATATVRGNHDHGAAQRVQTVGASGFRYLTMVTRRLTVARLSPADRRFLADLPTSVMLTLGGLRFLLVHASPRDPLDEYVPHTAEAWAARLADVRADFVCVGHTHVPSVLPVNGTTVLNPGSVGLQRDGDPRASYAVVEDGRVELKRVEYDVEAAVRAVDESPLEPVAKQMLTDIYRTGRYVHPAELPPPVPNPARRNGRHAKTNGVHRNGTLTPDQIAALER